MKVSLWKLFLIILCVVTAIHFVKDITQDILMFDTILNNFGNIEENISKFPEWLTWFYHWAMVNTVIGEVLILVYSIKSFLKNRFEFKKEEKIIIGSVIYIIVMFTIAYALR